MFIGEVKAKVEEPSKIEFFVACKQLSGGYQRGGELCLVEWDFIFAKVNSADMVPAQNGRAV